MTNEEIAVQIQHGNTELYNDLWVQCRKLLYYILARYQKRLELPNYINGEDLEQCMYGALRAAVKSYDSGKGYKFTSYLHFHVMNTVQAQLPNQHIAEISANQPIEDKDGDVAELLDFIADDQAVESFRCIELQELREQVRRAVAQLPTDSRLCIELNYFAGLTQKQIAAMMGYSESKVHAAIVKGLWKLHDNKALYSLYH